MLNFSRIIPKLNQVFQKPKLRHLARYEGILGTALELQLLTDSQAVANEAQSRVLKEINRLERVYSRFMPDSELNRWQAAGSAVPSPDLAWLLHEAEHWHQISQGAFHPAIQSLQEAYKNAVPSPEKLEQLRLELETPLWNWQENQVQKLTKLHLNFNALAKGRIADMACLAALQLGGVHEVLVNLGGDLCHRGTGTLQVAIAHPFSSAENAPAVAQVNIQNQGMATSGHTHRGAHLYDPRTAEPINKIAQATVIAADAASADVLATVFCVLEPQESLEFTESSQIACLLVANDGQIYTNAQFESQLSNSILEEIK